jgi:hypothetical protein
MATKKLEHEPLEVANVVTQVLRDLAARGTEDKRWLFPNGVTSIEVSASIGASGSSVTLKASGPASTLSQPLLTAEFAAHPLVVSGQVLDACRAVFDANKNDCNKFLKAVIGICKPSANFGAGDDANAIVAKIAQPPWSALGIGDAGAAVQAAKDGKLVIGGMTGQELSDPTGHGHVVVIHGQIRDDGVPFGSWGTLSTHVDPAKEPTPISACIKKSLLSGMHYASVDLS